MAIDDVHAEVSALLRHVEHRYTTGRQRLVDVLHEAGGPVTLPQILDSDANLAQSSVYRNLLCLEEAGVVSRIVTRDEHARFELAERFTQHHHHLICSACGDVADFELEAKAEDQLDTALATAAAAAGFAIEAHRLDLIGTCSNCT